MDEDGDEADGESSTTVPQAQPPVDSDDDDDDDDLEASIEKELAALKAGRGATGLVKKGDAKAKGKSKERPRFQSIQTDTECRASSCSLTRGLLAHAFDRSVLHRDGVAARPGRADGGDRLGGPGDRPGANTVRMLWSNETTMKLTLFAVQVRPAPDPNVLHLPLPLGRAGRDAVVAAHRASLYDLGPSSQHDERDRASSRLQTNRLELRSLNPPFLTRVFSPVRDRDLGPVARCAPLAERPDPPPRRANLQARVRTDRLVARARTAAHRRARGPQGPGPGVAADRAQERLRAEHRRGQAVEGEEVQLGRDCGAEEEGRCQGRRGASEQGRGAC